MAATTIDRGRLRRLADVRPERGRVLSVFLNLDPSVFATPPARASAITSVLTEAGQRIEACEGLEHDEHMWLRDDLERVRTALSDGGIASNGTRAVAVYACAPEALLEVVSLRRPVDTHVVVDRSPAVEPLVAEADGERWAIVLANRRNARIFQGSGHDIQETDRIQDDVHSQHDQGGWSQSRYQRGVEKEKDDHLTHVAEVLFRIYKLQGFDRLLVGALEELVGDFEQRLHPYLRERIVGRLHLDVENSSLEDVRAAAAEALEAHAARVEREALDRLTEGVGRGTRGAAGLADVLGALNEARVECLLVAEGFSATGVRDTETGLLYAHGAAPTGRPVRPVADVVEAAVEKALEQSARVLRISRHDDLGPLGGIGAVLRY
jgi:protein required for attachment to host cells